VELLHVEDSISAGKEVTKTCILEIRVGKEDPWLELQTGGKKER
jgi:hypothetical protein